MMFLSPDSDQKCCSGSCMPAYDLGEVRASPGKGSLLESDLMIPTTAYWRHRVGARTPIVPVVAMNMHRVFWVPDRYRNVAAVVLDGRRHTLKEIAARAGYSTASAARKALLAMQSMSVIAAIQTVRGRHGWTRVRVAGDAVVGKVSTTVRVLTNVSKGVRLSMRSTVVDTFGQRHLDAIECEVVA